MPRYKKIDTSPRFLPIDLEKQLLPGTFEHALNRLLDHDLDLSDFDARYGNDDTGASAYPPALLLKIILFGYARGMVSSRDIAGACREHVIFIALCGDQAPHFTTIADFVGSLGKQIADIFSQVLFICDAQGLIGREMFAIDGVKLPSNASKARSGTRADFEHQASKLEAAVAVMLERHRQQDSQRSDADRLAKETKRIERLQRDALQIRQWLAKNPQDRYGPGGGLRKSNRTDNESAKLATGKGVIQGYTGVAVVDAKHQLIVEAQAHGTGAEQELLIPVLDAMADLLEPESLVTADAGYYSEANLQALEQREIEALIADPGMRQRDERLQDQAKYKALPNPLHDKLRLPPKSGLYAPRDFNYDPQAQTCICPAGKQLYRNGSHCVINGYIAVKFQGAQRDCVPCAHRSRCLRHPHQSKTRQVAFFQGKATGPPESCGDRMRRRLDSAEGRSRYGGRFGTVEPVFGNLRHNKRLQRFTLRGRQKVDVQWKLFCLVHNVEKLAHQGYAQ
jgi:transposase